MTYIYLVRIEIRTIDGFAYSNDNVYSLLGLRQELWSLQK